MSPKNDRSLARYVRLLAFLVLIVPPLLSAAGESGESLWITADDGFKLHSRLHEAAGPAPAVLLLHQCDRESPLTGYERLAAMLAERGVHAIELDFRGYGRSVDETYDGRNWEEANDHFASDVTAVFRHVGSLETIDAGRVAIVGASCGGRYAAGLARSEEGIRALVFLSSNLGRSVKQTMAGLSELPVLRAPLLEQEDELESTIAGWLTERLLD